MARFWNCPVCHANFLSKKTYDRHVHLAHGGKTKVKARANAKPSKTATTAKTLTTHNGQPTTLAPTGPLDPLPGSHIESPYFDGACRVCGKNRPMPGEDTCFHCQSG